MERAGYHSRINSGNDLNGKNKLKRRETLAYGRHLAIANTTTNQQQVSMIDIMEGRWDERKACRGRLAIISGDI